MENTKKNYSRNNSSPNDYLGKIKVYIFSLIGVIIFYIPIKVNNEFETTIYHISYFFENEASSLVEISIIFFVLLSTLKNILDTEKFSVMKIKICYKFFSLVILISIFVGKEDLFFINDNFIYILKDLILDLSIVLPIASLFMPFLLDYGLVEMIEAYTHKIMKKLFKVSGKVFLIFLVYILVNNVCGVFVTYELYKKGKLRKKETAITILNFSIISLSLTEDLCRKIDITTIKFFIIEIIILIICNFIVSRIYPLKNKKQSYYFKSNHKNVNCRRNKMDKAIKKYYENKSNKKFLSLSLSYLNDVIYILMDLIPTIIFIFFIGNIIYNINFFIESINNITNIFVNIFRLPNSNVVANIINLNLFSSILAIESIPQNAYYIIRLMMGMFIALQCINFSLLTPFVKKSIIELSIREVLIVAFERLCIIAFICFIMYNFYLKYII